MNEPRTNWFQRLVGADGGSLTALEEQLLKAKEEAHQLEEQLASEREKMTEKERELAQAQERAGEAERDSEARLVAVRKAAEERLAAHEELEQRHQQVTGELAITRTQLTRQRDESSKLTKSLAAANAQLARVETAVQAARAQATQLESKLAERVKESEATSARVRELEHSSEKSAKDLDDAKRRLQAIETRASTVEHELAETKQSLQSAEQELQAAVAQLQSARADRDFAATMSKDAWRALERVVGEAAPLALALGVETGAVEGRASLAEATAALKTALERTGRCRALAVDSATDGLLVELHTEPQHVSGATSRWLAAFTTRFLEQSLGVELAVEEASVEQATLKLRLRTSAAIG